MQCRYKSFSAIQIIKEERSSGGDAHDITYDFKTPDETPSIRMQLSRGSFIQLRTEQIKGEKGSFTPRSVKSTEA